MSTNSVGLVMASAFFAPPPAHHHPRSGFVGLFPRDEFVCRKTVCWADKRRTWNIITRNNEIRIRARRRDEPSGDDHPSFGSAAAGIEPTLNNLGKWLVALLTSATILWKHDAEALWAAIGAVLNVRLSLALKEIIKQERPIPTLKSDPGMPSSHAQTFFYMVTFLCVSLVEWRGMSALTAILIGFFVVISSYFSWLRVSQQLHTLSQVIVGAVIGSVFCLSWLWLWHAFILQHSTSIWIRIVLALGVAAFCSTLVRFICSGDIRR